MRPFICAVLFCSVICLQVSPLTAQSSIQTRDGLVLSLENSGIVSGIEISGNVLPSAARGRAVSGWHVMDVQTGEEALFRNTALVRVGGGMRQTGKLTPLSVKMQIDYLSQGNYILIIGTVTDESGNERALDVTFRLPVQADGWLWESGLDDRQIVQGGNNTYSIYRFQQGSGTVTKPGASQFEGPLPAYPFTSISDPVAKSGITLAIPAEAPVVYDGGLHDGNIYMTVKIGTSPMYRTPDKTQFRMMLYSHDGTWGLRSALERYYGFFPRYYTDKVQHHGLGTEFWNPYDPDYSDHAFHLIAEPAGQARNVDEYIQLGDVEFARDHGMLSFPYTIWGQRQIFLKNRGILTNEGDDTSVGDVWTPDVPKNQALDSNMDEVWRTLDAWEPDAPLYYATTLPALNFKSPEEHRELIRSSVLHSPSGNPVVVSRTYWHKPALTFVTNPDPDLYSDRDVMTVGKFHLQYYRDHLLKEIPYMAGIFSDSMFGWGRYYNFRREHFRYADVPLTYHPGSKKVCLWNRMSLTEHLELLHDILPEKLVFTNGLRPNWFFHTAMSDIGAVETHGPERLAHPYDHSWYRIAMGPKPFAIWSYRGWDDEEERTDFWEQCLLYGYALSSRGVLAEPIDFNLGQGRHGTEIEDRLRNTYVHIQQAISEAGWQPVTLARTDTPADMRIERFGPDKNGTVYFSVFNTASFTRNTTLRINAKLPGINQITRIRTIHPRKQGISISTLADGTVTVPLNIKAKRTIVLAVE